MPPVSGKWYPQFREQKTADLWQILSSFEAASTVQESNCFIGHRATIGSDGLVRKNEMREKVLKNRKK